MINNNLEENLIYKNLTNAKKTILKKLEQKENKDFVQNYTFIKETLLN